MLPRFLWQYEKEDNRPVLKEHVQKKNLQVHGKPGPAPVHEGSLLKNQKLGLKNLYFPIISIGGLIFLILIVYTLKSSSINYPQNYIISLIFIFICLAGMSAALYPSRCTEVSSFKKGELSDEPVNSADKPGFRGHHPECETFKGHTFTLLGKKLCAGCSGLFAGAFFAVIGTLIYQLHGFGDYSYYLFWAGSLMVLASLLQLTLLDVNINWLKFVFNFILVFGSFLILAGINGINGNVMVRAYFLVLVLIWILTRISASESNHAGICSECISKTSCVYRDHDPLN